MEVILLSVLISALPSIVAATFYYKYRSITKELHKNPSYETQMILADLMTNGTLLRVERVPPEHVYLRRP
jgi:uncharacterized protein YneF (UPF0154 family)